MKRFLTTTNATSKVIIATIIAIASLCFFYNSQIIQNNSHKPQVRVGISGENAAAFQEDLSEVLSVDRQELSGNEDVGFAYYLYLKEGSTEDVLNSISTIMGNYNVEEVQTEVASVSSLSPISVWHLAGYLFALVVLCVVLLALNFRKAGFAVIFAISKSILFVTFVTTSIVLFVSSVLNLLGWHITSLTFVGVGTGILSSVLLSAFVFRQGQLSRKELTLSTLADSVLAALSSNDVFLFKILTSVSVLFLPIAVIFEYSVEVLLLLGSLWLQLFLIYILIPSKLYMLVALLSKMKKMRQGVKGQRKRKK